MDETTEVHADSAILDKLGGTAVVAGLCKVKPPSVSEWRRNGIPPARRQFLELLKPEAFAANDEGVRDHDLRPDVFGPAPAQQGEERADAA